MPLCFEHSQASGFCLLGEGPMQRFRIPMLGGQLTRLVYICSRMFALVPLVKFLLTILRVLVPLALTFCNWSFRDSLL